MASTIRTLMQNSIEAGYNPSAQYRASLRTLTSVLEGKIDNISPANPVVYVIESQATLVASFIETLKSETKKSIQVFATDPLDLYHHMADVHFKDIFAIPATSVFTILFNKVELLSNLVPIPGSTSKKISIPRDTYFTIADYTFGFHYAIDIIEQEHGGLRIVYDTTKQNNLERIASNILKYKTLKRDDIEYLAIDIPVHQFEITTKTPVVTKGNVFKYKIDYVDEFYALKAYRIDGSGNQEEIRVTYSEEVYDPLTPTIVVKYLNGSLEIHVPQVYINSDLIVGELRLDLYTTKGPLDMSFDSYPIGSVGHKFRDIDKNADTTYNAMLSRLGTVLVLPEERVLGGALAMPFNQLKQTVIQDAIGDPSLPITPAQIKNKLIRKGYDIVKNIDLITDRVFLASKNMPEAKNENLLTPANSSIESLTSSFTELVKSNNVKDNGSSITILSNSLFKISDGVLELVKNSEIASMNAMAPDSYARYISDRRFRYNPFHYVLDIENNSMQARAYYLDDPKVKSQTFIEDNETSLLQVNIDTYFITKTNTGYTLTVTLKSNAHFKTLVNAQIKTIIGFKSKTEPTYSWAVGTTVGNTAENEKIIEFKFDTNFKVNRNDQLCLTNFKMFDVTPIETFTDLLNNYTIMHCVDTTFPSTYTQSPINGNLPIFLVGANFIGICEERLEIKLGDSLDNLWTKARTISSSIQYETHATDVMLTYDNDVYEKDSITGSEILFDSNGNPYTNILHHAGDLILDINNQPQIKYPKGSLKYDTNGKPISKGNRFLLHRFEVFLIDGVYLLSNDPIAGEYRKHLADTVANWITIDLKQIQLATLDKTNIYFHPKTISGNIKVMTSEGLDRFITAEQSFLIELYIKPFVNSDSDLKEALTKKTILYISEYLGNQTLSNSEIVKGLREIYKDDVVDVQVSLFGVNHDIPVMHIFNDTSRCGLKKILKLREDGILLVQEDIVVTFRVI